MSRALERAYDIIARLGEKIGMQDISQFRIENARTPNMALVTNGQGGVQLVPTDAFAGGSSVNIPTPPLGQEDALTCDPAGVVQWGGKVSAGEF